MVDQLLKQSQDLAHRGPCTYQSTIVQVLSLDIETSTNEIPLVEIAEDQRVQWIKGITLLNAQLPEVRQRKGCQSNG